MQILKKGAKIIWIPFWMCVQLKSAVTLNWITFNLLIPTKKNHQQLTLTLSKSNISPENRPSQKEGSLPTINFQGLC